MGVIINNQNTKTLGFALVGRPSIASAKKKYETTEVEGRDGSLTRFLGYEDLKFSLNFNILFQSDIKQKLREIKGVFATASTLSFDDSPNFFYKIKQAQISETAAVNEFYERLENGPEPDCDTELFHHSFAQDQ